MVLVSDVFEGAKSNPDYDFWLGPQIRPHTELLLKNYKKFDMVLISDIVRGAKLDFNVDFYLWSQIRIQRNMILKTFLTEKVGNQS